VADAFIGYCGDPDLHDGVVAAVERDDDRVSSLSRRSTAAGWPSSGPPRTDRDGTTDERTCLKRKRVTD